MNLKLLLIVGAVAIAGTIAVLSGLLAIARVKRKLRKINENKELDAHYKRMAAFLKETQKEEPQKIIPKEETPLPAQVFENNFGQEELN